MGVIPNVIANTAAGNLFRSSYYAGASFLAVHVVPLYLLLAIVYKFFPFIETLLILQSFFVVFAAIPLFMLARSLGLRTFFAGTIAVLYLLHPANHAAQFYDFHELAFFPFVFFLYVYGIVAGREIVSLIALIFCLWIKEDISILILCALPMLKEYFEKRQLYLNVVICLCWYAIAMCILYAFGGKTHPYLWYYADLMPEGSAGFMGLIEGIISNPGYFYTSRLTNERLLYIVQTLAPVSFVPFFHPAYLLSVFPGFAMNLLSSNEKPELFSITFQYVWYVIPAMYACFCVFLHRLISVNQPVKGFLLEYVLILSATIASFVLSYKHGAFFDRKEFVGGYRPVRFDITGNEQSSHSMFSAISSQIPSTDWIVCSGEICPQLNRWLNVLPCRVWRHEEHNFIKWALVSNEKNCSEKALRNYNFRKVKALDRFALWQRE